MQIQAGFHIYISVNYAYAELEGTIDFSRAILPYTSQRKKASFAPACMNVITSLLHITKPQITQERKLISKKVNAILHDRVYFVIKQNRVYFRGWVHFNYMTTSLSELYEKF